MSFYYVQDVYHKNQLGTLEKKTEMIPGAKIISRKASVASVNRARESEPLGRGFRRWTPLKKILGFKEHLDWLKIDLNVVEIRTVQDYIGTKNKYICSS